MAWANCCTKSSSSIFLQSNRTICCCSGEFIIDRSARRRISSSTLGFRVLESGGLRPGRVCATERWSKFVGRLALRSSSSWTGCRAPLPTTTSTLKREAHTSSTAADGAKKSEVEKSPRRKIAALKEGKTIKTSALTEIKTVKTSALTEIKTVKTSALKEGKTVKTSILKEGKTVKTSVLKEGKAINASAAKIHQHSPQLDDSSSGAKSKVKREILIERELLPESKTGAFGVSVSLNGRSAGGSVRRSRGAGPEAVMERGTHVEAVRVVAVNFPSTTAMPAQQRGGSSQEGADEQRTRSPGHRKSKKKFIPVEALLRRDLNMCSKDGDVLRALDIYDKSVADKVVQWNQYNFNILLYLCSSAALGSITVRKSGTDRSDAERLNLQSGDQNPNGEGSAKGATSETQNPAGNGESMTEDGGASATTSTITVSPETMELAARRGFEIFEDMKRQQVPPNEATLTAVARLAVGREDGDLAFEMVKQMADMNIAPKLRSYSPAIVTYCKCKKVEKAFEVDAHMLAAGVQPEEPELGALLQLCVELGLENNVYSLLHRLRGSVRALAQNTVASIEEWFSGLAGALAGRENEQPGKTAIRQAVEGGGGGWHGLGWLGAGKWNMKSTTIDSEGFCFCCRKKLVTIDLDPQETENFAQSLSELAFARESKTSVFKNFQEWLDRHGPFDAIIDGANIGLFNQNFSQGGFNFVQLNAVARTAQEQQLVSKPPLIILHQARTRFGAANSLTAQKLLVKWSSTNSLYTTPNGSNDDWYWLYAAVKNRCLLITNDEMRDHLFQLLGNDFFPRWKERHQVRFSCTSRDIKLHLPPPYSLVIQESEDGSWHIPKSGSNDAGTQEWLCITRPGLPLDAIPVSRPKVAHADNGKGQMSHEMNIVLEKIPVLRPSSPESDETNTSPGRQKRSRVSSPSTTLRKIRAADKKSDSGPLVFDI